ncbi:Cyclin-like superfamily protein, putative [Babesia bigemina]|uniref:Cyclin-like superfamily protein, putative n=1 Tax=Babesia bigemina TaxID=5866 RepID=A0A061DCR0_BABBI|nr:Cyclin-like superfamily protein, putative [Babesia bigemina]CDR96829.1 Cyclin-like superfamily protein, putative [Babesia bigemina]|eukprot:XP_012769015.1 Cyclin-like superfamily protein, putative [Babesia bigemina]
MADSEAKDAVVWPQKSTHFSRWLLPSASSLQEQQQRAFTAALARVKGREEHKEAELPTLEDELWLVRFYAFQLSRFMAANHLKDSVKETALTFFNRFYLRRSMLEYDPRLIMFTCITLAIKLEDMWRNYYVDKLLGSVEGLDIAGVFALEATVCDALEFNFLVLHTSDSMHTIRMRCMEYLKESLGIDDEILGEHLGMILSVCSDAEKDALYMHEDPEFIFLHTPTQLAVANFARHCKKRMGSLLSVSKWVPRCTHGRGVRFLAKKMLHGDESRLAVLTETLQSINDRFARHMELRASMDAEEQKAGNILDQYLPLYSTI